jgi:hypothetical protein
MAVPAGRDRLVSADAVASDITEINAAINNFLIQPPNLVLISTLDQAAVTDNNGEGKGTTLDTAFPVSGARVFIRYNSCFIFR